MADAITVADLVSQQQKLQEAHDKAQDSLQDAKKEFDEVKAALVAFNNKYGRVLQMMREDE